MTRWLMLVLFALIVAPGCVGFVRVGAGPVFDSGGDNGIEVSLAVGVGFGDERGALSSVVAGGVDDLQVGPELSGRFDDRSMGYVGLGYRRRAAGERAGHGMSGRVGVGYSVLAQSSRRPLIGIKTGEIISVGVEAEGGVLWSGPGTRSFLALPIFIELFSFR